MTILDQPPDVPRSKEPTLDLYSDPHVLIIKVYERSGLRERLNFEGLVNAVRSALAPHVADIEAIWTSSFFTRWTVALSRSDGEKDASAAVDLLDGQLAATIAFPTALFPATPNARGRPGIAGTLEADIAQATEVCVYFILKFLSGFYARKVGREHSLAETQAVGYLQPFLTPLLAFHHLKSRVPSADRQSADVEQLVEDMRERAPAAVRRLWGENGRKGEAGRLIALGKQTAESGGRDQDPIENPEFARRIRALELLVRFRSTARAASDAQRGIRRAIGTTDLPSFDEALRQLPYPAEHVEMLARPSDMPPTLESAVELALDFDIDLTIIFGGQLYLRPMTEAARAVGRHERLGLIPDRTTAAGIIARYGLRALSGRHPAVQENDANDIIDMLRKKISGELALAADEELPRVPRLLDKGPT